MEREEKSTQNKYRFCGMMLWVITATFLVLLIGHIGFSIWNEYRDSFIQKQKEELLTITGALADNMEEMLHNYASDMERASRVLTYSEDEEEAALLREAAFHAYFADEEGYLKNLVFYNEEKEIFWQRCEMEFEEIYATIDFTPEITLKEAKGMDQRIYFIMEKQIYPDMTLSMVIDINKYYQKLIEDIRLGTNGYIVVKNSDGIIIMHPVKEQLGEGVIKGREEMYNEVDLASLEAMIKRQMEEVSGTAEYYSYWWPDPTLPRVKKVNAFSRVQLGDDFLVVAAVMDYDEIYEPIANGLQSILFTFTVILMILLVSATAFSFLLVQRQKNRKEIKYLKELNQVLEETKRGEDVIAHRQRLQIMGTMTGGIAHEFNNLLTPIMGYSEMLMDELRPDSDLYDYAKEIFEASDKAKEIIRQIAGLSRKNMETVFSYVPMHKTLKRTVKMIRAVCPSNIQLIVKEDFGEEGFLGNEIQINQVLLNICVNAFRAIGKEKAGTVTIEGKMVGQNEIKERFGVKTAEMWKDYLCLAITDNGCGMGKETIEQIFNPFFTTQIGGQGTGLGLSVAEQLIHSHKGYIFVESELGVGSTFYIYLPKAEEKDKCEVIKTEAEKDALAILVLDDNGKVLRLLERKFKKLGIAIDGVCSVEEAQKKLEETAYDVLLVDQELSRTGGDDFGLSFTFSINNKYPDMIKIVMTEQVRREIIEAKQHGYIDAYLEKPISDGQILETIHKIRD